MGKFEIRDESSDSEGGGIALIEDAMKQNERKPRRNRPVADPTPPVTYQHPELRGITYPSFVANVPAEVAAVTRDLVRNGKRKKLLVNEGVREEAKTSLEEIAKDTGTLVMSIIPAPIPGAKFRFITEGRSKEQAVLEAASVRAAKIKSRRFRRGLAALAVVGSAGVLVASPTAQGYVGSAISYISGDTSGSDNSGTVFVNDTPGTYGPAECAGTAEFDVTEADAQNEQPALTAMQAQFSELSVGDFNYVESFTKAKQRNSFLESVGALNEGASIDEVGTHTGPVKCEIKK